MATATATPMTMTQKIIAIAVTIIIISTVAVPVINDAADQFVITENNTGQRFNLTNDISSVDVSITLGGGKCIVNGYSFTPVNYDVIVYASTFVIRAAQNGTSIAIACEGTQYDVQSATIIGDTLSFTASSVEHTVTYSDYLLYPSENGKYGYFLGDGTEFYVNAGEDIYFAGTNYTATNNNLTPSSFHWYGILKGSDGHLNSMWTESRTEGVDNIISASCNLSKYTDMGDGTYKVTIHSETVTVVTETGSYTTTLDYRSGLVAPLAYKVYSDSSLYNLISVIPILLFLVPLMLAVRMIALRRN